MSIQLGGGAVLLRLAAAAVVATNLTFCGGAVQTSNATPYPTPIVTQVAGSALQVSGGLPPIVLTGSPVELPTESTSGAVEQVAVLTGSPVELPTESTSGAVEQVAVLTGSPVELPTESTSGAVEQVAVLTGSPVELPTESTSGAVEQVAVLTGSPVELPTESTSGAVIQPALRELCFCDSFGLIVELSSTVNPIGYNLATSADVVIEMTTGVSNVCAC